MPDGVWMTVGVLAALLWVLLVLRRRVRSLAIQPVQVSVDELREQYGADQLPKYPAPVQAAIGRHPANKAHRRDPDA